MDLKIGKKKKKKGLGGKKPSSRRQLLKTLSYYRSKGVPMAFIQDSIISGYGKIIDSPTKTDASIVADRGGFKEGMGYTRRTTGKGGTTDVHKKITKTTGRRGTTLYSSVTASGRVT